MTAMWFVRAAALALLLASASATESCCGTPRLLKAKGTAYAPVPENRTVVRLSLFVQGPNAVAAINNMKSVMMQAEEALRSQTTVTALSVKINSIYPEYNYNYNQQTGQSTRTFKGYSANGAITYEIPELDGGSIQAAISIDGVEFSNIEVKESYDVLVAARKEALRNSVYEAKVNAEKMLETVNYLKLGKIVEIDGEADDYISYAGGDLRVVRAVSKVTFEIYE